MQNTDCYIYHHLGLGDHIICNGLVRYVIDKNKFKKVKLVVKESNLNNVKRMFSDRPEISYFVVQEDEDFSEYYSENKQIPLFKIGFEKSRNQYFDRSFYDSLNVPFSERWDSWHLERDAEQENKIIKDLNIKEDYIFVHDLSSVGKYDFKIDTKYRIIKPSKTSSEKTIFDWIKVIEDAKEIHAMSSSFVHLINSLELNNRLYFHDIKHAHGMKFSLRNNWEIINY